MTELDRKESMLFEENNFAQECLDAFDANIAQIEKDYAVTSKSA